MANSICMSSGHGAKVAGAIGILNEHNEAVRVVEKVAEYLRQVGVTVYTFHDNTSTTQNQNLATIVNYHNSKNRELDVSIHFNAASRTDSPRGTEVLYYNQSGLASNVSSAIANVSGLIDRGGKQNNGLYFLNKTAKPAILIEVCFVDSSIDAKIYNAKFDNICKAIAETISGKKLVSQPVQPVQSPTAKPSIVYAAHVQNIGWQGFKRDGETAGTTGQSLRLEALTVKLENSSAHLEMEGHVENLGWTAMRTNGEIIGTIGEGLRLEAIKIKANGLNVLYRVHVQDIGWTDWKKDGEVAGTEGQSKRIEAIEIKLG